MPDSSAPRLQLVASEAGATIPGVDESTYFAFLYDLAEEVAQVRRRLHARPIGRPGVAPLPRRNPPIPPSPQRGRH